MNSHSIQNGQTEVGIVEHSGQQFAALGSSTSGTHVTGYLSHCNRMLTSWGGKVILSGRVEHHGSYRTAFDGDTAEGVVWWLSKNRAIAGYSLGAGMLFRGELLYGTPKEIIDQLQSDCEHWQQVDQDDHERDHWEQQQDTDE
jgi:hypothetical protein